MKPRDPDTPFSGTDGLPAVVEASLDGEPIVLPPPACRSVRAVRHHFEALASRSDRVLSQLFIDGVDVLASGVWAGKGFRRVQGATLSLPEFRRQLLERAMFQSRELAQRADDLALLMLINDWNVVCRLWLEYARELRAPAALFAFAEELTSAGATPPRLLQRRLRAHTRRFAEIWQQIELALAKRNVFELSDELERSLRPWLDDLSELLRRMIEQQA